MDRGCRDTIAIKVSLVHDTSVSAQFEEPACLLVSLAARLALGKGAPLREYNASSPSPPDHRRTRRTPNIKANPLIAMAEVKGSGIAATLSIQMVLTLVPASAKPPLGLLKTGFPAPPKISSLFTLERVLVK